MENTLSYEELNRVPTAEEKVLLAAMQVGAASIYLGSPIALDDNRIVTSVDWADGSLSIAAQPDVPRNITVALTDADDSVTGLLTITGKDAAGRTVSETMQPDGAGGGKTLTGTKIFAQVDSAVITDTAGATGGVDQLIIGVGNVIGLPFDIGAEAAVIHAYLGGTKVTPDAVATGVYTSGVDASGGTYDGSKVLQVFANPVRNV
ncbi:MAG: hypothetical protein JSW58_07395 [Candidatus Latescibacterota bacterium]|nr:MAG: hypothetical protein JSW58_07395 [Candidatus Latescibacterota bacterium]